MAAKLKNDSALRDLLRQFFPMASAAVCKKASEAKDTMNAAMRGECSFQITGGLTYRIERDLALLHADIVNRTVKLLGSKIGDEEQVSKHLWAASVRVLTAEDDERVEPISYFLGEVEKSASG